MHPAKTAQEVILKFWQNQQAKITHQLYNHQLSLNLLSKDNNLILLRCFMSVWVMRTSQVTQPFNFLYFWGILAEFSQPTVSCVRQCFAHIVKNHMMKSTTFFCPDPPYLWGLTQPQVRNLMTESFPWFFSHEPSGCMLIFIAQPHTSSRKKGRPTGS